MAAGGRLMTGESLFITHFTNESQAKARVAFAAPYPGSILPVNLADLPGQTITCRKYKIVDQRCSSKEQLLYRFFWYAHVYNN